MINERCLSDCNFDCENCKDYEICSFVPEESNDYDGLDLGSAMVEEIYAQNGSRPYFNKYNGCWEV